MFRSKVRRWADLLGQYERGEAYAGLPWYIDGVDVTASHRWGERIGVVLGTVWRWCT